VNSYVVYNLDQWCSNCAPQAHFLYYAAGEYDFYNCNGFFIFSPSLCTVDAGFIFTVNHQE
jgi:hypothetical protein